MPSDVLRALYEGRREDAEALARGRDLDLHEAAALGRTDRLAHLLDHHDVSRPADDGFTALHLAVFFAHDDAARLLVERGADVEAVGPGRLRPLHSAAAGGHAGLVSLLLEAGASPDSRQDGGFTALHQAAMRGDQEMAGALLSAGAAVDARDDEGRSAADFAERGGDPALAEWLRRW